MSLARCAQRRPGHSPRRQVLPRYRAQPQTKSLNEGRGIHPGDSPETYAAAPQPFGTLNEGRGIHPGDSRSRLSESCSTRPLNEGRGIHPGDRRGTRPRSAQPWRAAQRRPGHSPRRQGEFRPVRPGVFLRSTKAGAFTPATGRVACRAPSCNRSLNEGRGIHPGDRRARRGRLATVDPLNEGRGIHPGDRRPPAVQDLRGTGRSTKAGAFTPATGPLDRRHSRGSGTLNEGRGIHPGDRPHHPEQIDPRDARSTKAGAFTPATAATRPGNPRKVNGAQRRPGHSPRRQKANSLAFASVTVAQRRPGHSPRRQSIQLRNVRDRASSLNEGRGIHPGDRPTVLMVRCSGRPAQRRPGHSPRRQRGLRDGGLVKTPRSTKAGAFTPATAGLSTGVAPTVPALNEGRGIHPGDSPGVRRAATLDRGRSTKAGAFTPATAGKTRPPTEFVSAQRRPGHSPRRQSSYAATPASRALAQRRPGHSPRRQPDAPRLCARGRARSTKAGAFTPATAHIQLFSLGSGVAQRRPGHSPRRQARHQADTLA